MTAPLGISTQIQNCHWLSLLNLSSFRSLVSQSLVWQPCLIQFSKVERSLLSVPSALFNGDYIRFHLSAIRDVSLWLIFIKHQKYFLVFLTLVYSSCHSYT